MNNSHRASWLQVSPQEIINLDLSCMIDRVYLSAVKCSEYKEYFIAGIEYALVLTIDFRKCNSAYSDSRLQFMLDKPGECVRAEAAMMDLGLQMTLWSPAGKSIIPAVSPSNRLGAIRVAPPTQPPLEPGIPSRHP